MTQIKAFLSSNTFQSFCIAVLIWFADFIKSNSNLSWEGFAVGLVGFIGTYATTHFSVKQTIAKVETGEVTVTAAPAIVPVVEGGSKTTTEAKDEEDPFEIKPVR